MIHLIHNALHEKGLQLLYYTLYLSEGDLALQRLLALQRMCLLRRQEAPPSLPYVVGYKGAPSKGGR